MTAEVAILNKSAVALAADSAITISTSEGGHKIFNSVNKLFGLSKYRPVGIMIYNNSQVMEIPCETIIKTYRDKLAKNPFPRLEDYGKDFIRFLSNRNPLFTGEKQRRYVQTSVSYIFDYVKNVVALSAIRKTLSRQNDITPTEITAIFDTATKVVYDSVRSSERIKGFSKRFERRILVVYKKEIEQASKEVFQRIPISARTRRQLRRLAIEALARNCEEDTMYSGVVIAGFGEKEEFPSLLSFLVYGVIDGKLKYVAQPVTHIAVDNRATIVPFAQRKEADAFLRGIHPDYSKEIHRYVERILLHFPAVILDSLSQLSAQMKNRLRNRLARLARSEIRIFKDGLTEYEWRRHWSSVIQAVSFLPKDELGAMAEALVNITSLKRRVSTDQETVGGPTDVAVISKGDGFVWIKRKEYFDIKLNPHFLARYNR